MVPASTLLAAGCGLALCLGVPVLLALWLALKRQSPFLPLLAGAASYLLWRFLLPLIVSPLAGLSQTLDWLYALAWGIASGLLLEGGAAAGFLLLRGRRKWTDAVALGLGAGGTNALFGTGIYLFNYLFYANLANGGGLEDYALQNGVAASAYPEFLHAIVDRDAGSLLLAGLSQLFLLLLRPALSLLVLEAVRRRKPLLLGIAVASHLLTDSLVSLLTKWELPAWIPCLLLGALALAAGILVWRRKPWKSKPASGGESKRV